MAVKKPSPNPKGRKAITLKDGQILLPLALGEAVVETIDAAKVLVAATAGTTAPINMKDALELAIKIRLSL